MYSESTETIPDSVTSVKFRSKCDAWLLGLLWFAISVQLAAAVVLFVAGEMWIGLLPLASAGFVTWLLRSTYYEIDDTRLLIRSGPFWWNVPLDAIEEITPTHNPVSSPALSLDRLCVRYRRGKHLRMIVISPDDKQGFLQSAAAIVPGAVVQGESLRRISQQAQ